MPTKQQDKLKLDVSKSKRDKAKKLIKKLDEGAQKIYSSSDDVMKLSAYKSLRNVGYTEERAIKRVFEGFQNYATVGKAWDFAAKTPIVGNAYIKFQADLQRIVKNAITKRPLTTASFLASLRIIAIMLSKAFGEEDEEREERETRPFIPKIDLAGTYKVPLVFKIGKNKELNISRFISPYYEYDIPNKAWIEKATSFAPYQWTVSEAKEMGQTTGGFETPDVFLGSLWAAIASNKDFRDKSISDPYATRYKESGLTEEEKFMNRLEYVLRSVIPLYSTGQDLYKSHTYGEDFYGRDKSVLDIIISKVAKVQTFDNESLKKTVLSKLKSIEYQEKTITNKISSIRKKGMYDLREIRRRVDEGKLTETRGRNISKKIADEQLERVNKQLELLVKEQEKLNKTISNIHKLDLDLSTVKKK